MNNKIKSLRAMAQSALTEYSDESSSGGEPDYPQWAQDLLDVLDALDEIGAGGVSVKIVDDRLRKDAERYRWLLSKLQQSYDGEDFESDSISIYSHMASQCRGNRTVKAEIFWRDKADEPVEISEAIDHARRVDGRDLDDLIDSEMEQQT